MMKYVKYWVGLFVLVVIGSFWLGNKVQSDTPPFILTKLKELKSDKILMDSIGGFKLFEYSYNELDFEREDTVAFSIKITGRDHNLIYKGVQVKPVSKPWELVSDTLTIIP